MKKSKSSTNLLNDELRFLIACCQAEPLDKDIEFIYSFIQHSTFLELNSDTSVVKTKEGCNIQHLLTLSSQHGVLPLVYKTIKKIVENDSQSIQNSKFKIQNFLSELKPYYMTIVQRNMLMTSELIKIMHLLRENHIEALAFKGPTLSQMAYGDITLRQYSDLDILVDESDAYKAGKLMSENGHKAILPLYILSNKTCLHTAKDFSLMSESGGVHTELHWRLFEKKYNISVLSCTVEKKCQTVTINNHEIQTLQNEPLLVYLCLHGAKHAFERIEWICDIDRFIRSSEINWEEVIGIAERSHSKRSFYLALSLAHNLLHTKLPEKIIKKIDTDDIKILHTMTLKQMSEKKNERSDFEKNKETFFYQAKLFDQTSDMFKFYLSTLFKISTNDCQTFVLPENLKFLYIILRPIRLIHSYISRLFVTRNT